MRQVASKVGQGSIPSIRFVHQVSRDDPREAICNIEKEEEDKERLSRQAVKYKRTRSEYVKTYRNHTDLEIPIPHPDHVVLDRSNDTLKTYCATPEEVSFHFEMIPLCAQLEAIAMGTGDPFIFSSIDKAKAMASDDVQGQIVGVDWEGRLNQDTFEPRNIDVDYMYYLSQIDPDSINKIEDDVNQPIDLRLWVIVALRNDAMMIRRGLETYVNRKNADKGDV